jgi:hypothetical protein
MSRLTLAVGVFPEDDCRTVEHGLCEDGQSVPRLNGGVDIGTESEQILVVSILRSITTLVLQFRYWAASSVSSYNLNLLDD